MTVDTQRLTQTAGSNGNSRGQAPVSRGPGEARAPLSCPACGGENAPDAVFCANPACHKALGDFRYVLEEMRQEARWHETLAEKAVAFIGKPHFVSVHVLWFALWAALNTGILGTVWEFDEYPFVFLGIILAAEAIFISGFVLISSNRQTAHAEKRAELDYEVNVQTYRHITEINASLGGLVERMERLEAAVRDGQARTTSAGG